MTGSLQRVYHKSSITTIPFQKSIPRSRVRMLIRESLRLHPFQSAACILVFKYRHLLNRCLDFSLSTPVLSFQTAPHFFHKNLSLDILFNSPEFGGIKPANILCIETCLTVFLLMRVRNGIQIKNA